MRTVLSVAALTIATATTGLAQGRWAAPIGPPVVRVNCDGGQTISAALARLKHRRRLPLTSAVISVSGVCHESVVVEGFDDLTISGRPGATLTTTATGDLSAPLRILTSRTVRIEHLTIDAADAAHGIEMRRCQDCYVTDTTILNGDAALQVGRMSYAKLSQITVSGARVLGVIAIESAYAELDHSLVEGTGWLGLWASMNGTLEIESTTVRGFWGGIGATENSYARSGVYPSPGGDLTVRLEDNTFCGVVASGGGVVSLGSPSLPVIISNNGRFGVNVSMGGMVGVNNAQIAGHETGAIVFKNGQFAIRDSSIVDSTVTAITGAHSSLIDVSSPVTLFNNATDVYCDALSEVTGSANFDTGGNPLQADCPNLH